ncbi:hypothetical protein [Kitasatospora aureofaciens]|uniref:hypothetical protein n=1 Tax=Kitasatospora aureofaciens TaxID=1894 RepID=UPI000AFB3A78|nr:hypothetical protein [Kitasatospora aureofaciens]
MSIRRRSWAVATRGRAGHRHGGPEEAERSPADGSRPPRPRPPDPDAPAAGLEEDEEQPDHPDPPATDPDAP